MESGKYFDNKKKIQNNKIKPNQPTKNKQKKTKTKPQTLNL